MSPLKCPWLSLNLRFCICENWEWECLLTRMLGWLKEIIPEKSPWLAIDELLAVCRQPWKIVKESGFWVQAPWVPIPPLLLPSCVISGKSLNLSVP